jgi:hypothetical protein
MNVATFAACCADCGGTFSHPDLGDFSYGVFVFTGEQGSVFAIFDAIGHPVFGVVERVLAEAQAGGEHGGSPSIPEICANLADPVASQRLRCHHICPLCQSASWKWWGGDRTGAIDIADASYAEFQLLSEQEKRQRILAAFTGTGDPTRTS